MIEVEYYRRVAERTIGRTITRVVADDEWFLKGGTTARALRTALRAATITGTDRIGKLLLLETDGATVGLRFGMTGRLLVDGEGPIEKLEYASDRKDPAWIRFALAFDGGGTMQLEDPRRLGGVELAPEVGHMGVDALRIKPAAFRRAVAASRAPVKAWLLDQGHIAGVGNLLADEVLWQAGIDPGREARSLDEIEATRLHQHLRRTITRLMARGGSHTGDLQIARARGAVCPRDGAPLRRRTIGGRTTYSCSLHQA